MLLEILSFVNLIDAIILNFTRAVKRYFCWKFTAFSSHNPKLINSLMQISLISVNFYSLVGYELTSVKSTLINQLIKQRGSP
jgi:hypothetical protein